MSALNKFYYRHGKSLLVSNKFTKKVSIQIRFGCLQRVKVGSHCAKVCQCGGHTLAQQPWKCYQNTWQSAHSHFTFLVYTCTFALMLVLEKRLGVVSFKEDEYPQQSV